MQSTRIPQGITPPSALTINVVPAGSQPPVAGPLSVGVACVEDIDLTTPTGATIAVLKPDGTIVAWSATYAAAPSLGVTGASETTPIVLTVATTEVLTGPTPKVTVAGVGGNTAANGAWFAHVLDGLTFALYQDDSLLFPAASSGAYTSGGTATPNDSATVVHNFADATTAAPQGELDQIGVYHVAASLSVAGGSVPCEAALLEVVSPFADGLG